MKERVVYLTEEDDKEKLFKLIENYKSNITGTKLDFHRYFDTVNDDEISAVCKLHFGVMYE